MEGFGHGVTNDAGILSTYLYSDWFDQENSECNKMLTLRFR